nr:unnamed protein product [Spirometra erinaceieuropaei]
MSEEYKKPFRICEDLQNLIMITLEHIILPLRKELRKCSEYSEILSLEIQDGENKTFEYIAQQISEINNVDEEAANEILKHFPQSEVCFRCLGIDEDTLHGFLWIRGLDFSHLFDMQKDEVVNLLKTYKVSSDDIKHILTGLSKIRGNVELLENGLSFEDDTRNLIKLVIKLTEPSDTTRKPPDCPSDSVLHGPPPLAFEARYSSEDATPNISSVLTKLDSASPKSSSKMSGKAKSPDPQPPPSTICCETSVFRFPTPTHISNSSSSPKNQILPSTFQLGSRPDACGALVTHNDTIAPGTNGLLSVPIHPTLIGGTNQALPGNTHKFETETNLGDIVRGPLCSVCNCRILLRSQHCIYCNLKTHKQCVSNAYLIPCPGPSRLFRSLEGQRSIVNCGRVNNPAGITPLLSAGNLPMGSDSNSASSCTSCSTPGSPFPLDAGRQALPTGPGLVATRSPTCVYSQSGIIDLAYTSAAVGDERICPTGLPQHAFVTPASGPNSPCPAHTAGQAMDPTACPTPGGDLHRMRHSPLNVELLSPLPPLYSCSYLDRLSRLESTESQEDYPVFMRNNSLSVSLRDWNIPMSALQLGEMIGRGTFGTVYRGKWHGEVAVKIIDFDPDDPDSRFSVDAFKREVVTLLKTRHENLVLFMGACMKPPNLAIVTQLSKAETIRALNIGCVDSEAASDLPFTPESDVFAFGTVWYELLTSEYPYQGLPTETLLYLVGNGVKPALQIPCPKDFKEILVQCWSFHPHRRPEFTNLVRLLDCLPKLHRSPSYPTKRPSLANPISHDPLLV